MMIARSRILWLTTCLLCWKRYFSFLSVHVTSQQQKRNERLLATNSSPSTSSTTSSSTGQAIQDAQSPQDLFAIPLWLPTDDNLPPHFRSQHVHHEKRQRWSALWLTRLTEWSDSSDALQHESFARAVLAAAMPYEETTPPTRKETQAIRQSLVALHTVLRSREVNCDTLPSELISGIHLLIQRAEQMADSIPLQEAIEVRWAARGLLTLVATAPEEDHRVFLAKALPQLEERVSKLPFDILPRGVPLNNPMQSWQQDIPFQFDTIVTRTGSNVLERRGTAWVAQEGIGALAYSGKLMAPHPLPGSVESVMRQVERAIGIRTENFFDCALCNFYPNGESACKFHTDPEHGTVWDRLTCVVAAGDARRFAFRPIQTSWEDWESNPSSVSLQKVAPNEPAVIRLFPGDIVHMFGTCNDDFHHAVYPDSDGEGRVSLVLKRALRRGTKGQRGHGLVGEGRRSRRKR